LKEPYRLEGKKTMGLELAEQCGMELPDVILYPTGGGTGLIGMWKAFAELSALGWLKSSQRPRMYAAQSDGCAPIVRAYDEKERFARTWEKAATCASGLRVPAAVGDFMILDAVRESGGAAIGVPEKAIAGAMRRVSALDGILLCPESAACVLAAEILIRSKAIAPAEKVVLFNTGAATKYVEAVPSSLPLIENPQNVDFTDLVR
jgi:threonine synthase